MKAIDYRHNWSSDKTDEQEKAEKFGKLLHGHYRDEPYQVEDAELYYDGKYYYFLEANGCSCWDGDWDGWQFTKTEVIKWAKAKVQKQEYDWRKQSFEYLAEWIVENIKIGKTYEGTDESSSRE